MDNNRNTRERDQRRGNTSNSQAKARAEMNAHRQTVHSEYRGGFDPRSVSSRQPSRVSGAGSRRPSGRNGGNEERALWTLIVIIGVLVVIAVAMLLKILNTDRPTGVDETVERQTTALTPEQTELQTDAQTEAVTTVPETQEPPIPVPTFKADLSAYEAYMNPQGAERDAYLLLVNPDNPLSSGYVPPNLVDVKSTRKDGQRATQKLQEYAAKALEALMLEAEACGMATTNTPSGYPLSVMSAYRTYNKQGELFNTYVNSEMANKGLTRAQAEAIVVTYSCRPGTSEHQSGLCVDMHTIPAANVSFKNQPEAKWLAENCHKFGFILRFPEDKTDITKITYEPWHFRYVGRYHAVKMKDLGMCLEEYVEYLKTNG